MTAAETIRSWFLSRDTHITQCWAVIGHVTQCLPVIGQSWCSHYTIVEQLVTVGQSWAHWSIFCGQKTLLILICIRATRRNVIYHHQYYERQTGLRRESTKISRIQTVGWEIPSNLSLTIFNSWIVFVITVVNNLLLLVNTEKPDHLYKHCSLLNILVHLMFDELSQCWQSWSQESRF